MSWGFGGQRSEKRTVGSVLFCLYRILLFLAAHGRENFHVKRPHRELHGSFAVSRNSSS